MDKSRRSKRKGRWIAATAAIGAAVLLLAPFGERATTGTSPTVPAQTFTKSVNQHAYFFRLTAQYMHGDEIIDFDIVVGCGVRVTVYGDESSSYDSLFDPRFFVKATRDGGAILLDSPNACGGETTEGGEVPKDYLPTTVWFEKVGDFTLGTAYLSEDAFENPQSKLKFLGAAIHKATLAEWDAFQPVFAQNLLSTKPFMYGTPAPPDSEIAANLWSRTKLAQWLPSFQCYGVRRFHLTDPAARELLREYWPSDKPRFWMPSHAEIRAIRTKFRKMNGGEGPLINGFPYKDYLARYEARGWPTRARGGTFYKGTLPAEIYPLRVDDAVPWLTPAIASAATIYRDIDMRSGGNAGFAYCYSWLRYQAGTSLLRLHFPDYFQRHFQTRIDGEPIHVAESPGPTAADIPYMFFENDEYFYEGLSVGF